MVVLSFLPPTPQQRETCISQGLRLGLNYGPGVGLTEAGKDATEEHARKDFWFVNHRRVKVGQGRECFQRARSLLQSWGHFQLGWANAYSAAVKVDAPVCVCAKSLFLWTANPLKVVYVSDTSDNQQQQRRRPHQGLTSPRKDVFAFGSGCLHGHLLAGEERFSVEHDHSDDSVWYEVLSFSRPVHPLSIVSYPIARWFQHKFAVDSATAVERAVMGAPHPSHG